MKVSLANKFFAFNVWNLEVAKTVLQVAKQKELPVIIQTSSLVAVQMDRPRFAYEFHDYASYTGVQAILHLDHCHDMVLIEDCYRSGWDSVLFDGSHLPLDRNIAQTRAVREIADRFGGYVEGEVGQIPGAEDDLVVEHETLAGSEDALRFAAETGVDLLAVAVGTFHGVHEHEPEVDFNRLDDIHRRTGKPLVLHGGSGLSSDVLRRALKLGVHKINISTELKLATRTAYHSALDGSDELHFNPTRADRLLRENLTRVVSTKLDLLKGL